LVDLSPLLIIFEGWLPVEKTPFFLAKIGNVLVLGLHVGECSTGNTWRPHAVESFLVTSIKILAQLSTCV
jgi:hypothetical protein